MGNLREREEEACKACVRVAAAAQPTPCSRVYVWGSTEAALSAASSLKPREPPSYWLSRAQSGGRLAGVIAHLVDCRAGVLVHVPAALLNGLAGGLGLINRRLAGLELLALVRQGAGLVELPPKLVRRVSRRRLRAPAPKAARDERAGDTGGSCDPGQAGAHRGDATLVRASCSASVPLVPGGASRRGRPDRRKDGT